MENSELQRIEVSLGDKLTIHGRSMASLTSSYEALTQIVEEMQDPFMGNLATAGRSADAAPTYEACRLRFRVWAPF